MTADTPRQHHILESALAQFLARGYDATSVADIARGAGVSKPTVYNHFENKRALFLQAARAVIDRVHRAFDAADIDAAAGHASLRTAAARLVRIVTDERVINLYRLVISDAGTTADLRSIATNLAESPAHASLARLIERLRDNGDLNPCDPREAASALVDLTAGRLVLHAVLNPWDRPGEHACRAHADRGVARFLALYAPVAAAEQHTPTPAIITRPHGTTSPITPTRHGPAA